MHIYFSTPCILSHSLQPLDIEQNLRYDEDSADLITGCPKVQFMVEGWSRLLNVIATGCCLIFDLDASCNKKQGVL